MNKIKLIIDTLDVREICLQITHDYYPKLTTVESFDGNIIIKINAPTFEERIYGREIDGKYYFARHQFIEKYPDIDYYSEFFSNGHELKFKI